MGTTELRIVIMGACGECGSALADAFRGSGADLVLADHDASALSELGRRLNAKAIFCDVASPSSVAIFASEIARRWSPIDVLINAAGSGYERTLGMHRVSRALMPLLRSGRGSRWIINVPSSREGEPSPLFPYASSQEAFARLSEAIALEARGSGVSVGIASPSLDTIAPAGVWLQQALSSAPETPQLTTFARRVAVLLRACAARTARGFAAS